MNSRIQNRPAHYWNFAKMTLVAPIVAGCYIVARANKQIIVNLLTKSEGVKTVVAVASSSIHSYTSVITNQAWETFKKEPFLITFSTTVGTIALVTASKKINNPRFQRNTIYRSTIIGVSTLIAGALSIAVAAHSDKIAKHLDFSSSIK